MADLRPFARMPPRRGRRYLLGVLGLVLAGLLVAGYLMASRASKLIKIDAAQAIDEALTRTYGKYSPEKKGWIFIDESNEPFLVQVVQQARIETPGMSDELYFVASAVSLKGTGRNLYGVFQLRADSKPGGGLVEISSPFRYESDVPVTAAAVRFTALAERTWGWVVQVQTGARTNVESVVRSNVMLAPHGEQIALLARFKAAVDAEPGNCARANADYELWRKAVVQASGHHEAGSEVDGSEVITLEETEPLRCEHSRWSYRSAEVGSHPAAQPAPLTVSVQGSQYGAPLPAQSWTLPFDSAAFAYVVPEPLAVE